MYQEGIMISDELVESAGDDIVDARNNFCIIARDIQWFYRYNNNSTLYSNIIVNFFLIHHDVYLVPQLLLVPNAGV